MERKELKEKVFELSKKLDFMKDGPQLIDNEEGIKIHVDEQGRDQIVWVVFYKDIEDQGLYDKKLLELASDILWTEELGWDDLDAITWDIQVGDNFHGLPGVMPDMGLPVEEDQDKYDPSISWLRIQCVDWAS